MYNELFTMLSERSEEDLRSYWMAISRLQKGILGPYIEQKGLNGMYEYWQKIKVEENCDMDLNVNESFFEIDMHMCPSLSKNLDNDAGLCQRYCDHCAGWINPVITSFGYFPVYDVISRTEPRCRFRVYKDKKEAVAFAKHAELLWDPYDDLGFEE
jgi:hypothetical protein